MSIPLPQPLAPHEPTTLELLEMLKRRCPTMIFMGQDRVTGDRLNFFAGDNFRCQGMAMEIVRVLQDSLRQECPVQLFQGLPRRPEPGLPAVAPKRTRKRKVLLP